MSYASGEQPMIGDCVEDKKGRQAKVVDFEKANRIMIRWDEGVVEMEYFSNEFILISRTSQKRPCH